MIQSFACCEGCGYQVPGTEHPVDWLTVAVEGEPTHHLCSRACLFDQYGSDVVHARQLAALGLVEQDVQILKYIALGRSNAEIGQEITRKESTVKNRLALIFGRLGARSRLEVVLLAHTHGIINLSMLAQQFGASQT